MLRAIGHVSPGRRALSACVLGLVLAVSACGSAPAPEIPIVMTDHAFEPARISVERAKKTVLLLQNKGTVEHNIVLKQQDVTSPTVAPGQTVKFEVQLPPGTFPLICSVEGHEEAGMVAQIVSARGR
jgi:uncharacterized cupredoxin-like copper-binding protein